MEQTTMQAIGFRRYGPAEVLESLTLPRPVPSAGEVLVRVVAAGVNPADWLLRQGALRFFVRLKFPFVPGSDLAGVVEAVGPGVSQFRPGQAVYAMSPTAKGGAYAEYICLAADALAPLPANLTFAEAAAVPLAALTALQALRDQGELRPGQRVLVNGASGGVGSFAVQIAKALGGQVTGVASGANLDLVRSLGAEEALDYKTAPIFKPAQLYDLIFDAVGLYSFKEWQPALAVQGRLVTVNFTKATPWAQLGKGGRLKGVFVKPSGSDLACLNQWIEAGQLKPVIENRYSLSQAAAAHQRSETKRVRGKLVLLVDERLADTRPATGSALSQTH